MLEDDERFMRYFRVSRWQFNYILEKIQSTIEKETTNMRLPITPAERLAIFIRYELLCNHLVVLCFIMSFKVLSIGHTAQKIYILHYFISYVELKLNNYNQVELQN